MSGNLNKVQLIGNVCKEPEIRSTTDGRAVANLVLATSETWKDKASGEKKERAEFHRISCFSEGLVNLIKNYVHKGSKLYIEGKLQTRKWQDDSGKDCYATEIILQGYDAKIILLDKPVRDEHNQETEHDESSANQDSGVPF
jgi:single-strand DNA-binding protein